MSASENSMEKNQILARPAELFIKHYYIIEGKIATYYLHFTENERLYFLHRSKTFWQLYFTDHSCQENNL